MTKHLRDVHRGLGETEKVARLQGVIDRHLDSFSSREQVTAMVLLDDAFNF